MNKSILFDRKRRSINTWFYAFFILAVVLFASCSDGFEENNPYTSSVHDTKLSSPDSITFTKSSDGSEVTISWPVVYGAGGYQVSFYDIDNPDSLVAIGTANDTIDGCSVTFDISEDTKYEVLVKTLGNSTYNNTTADSSKVAYYSTLSTAYATIPSGTDLTDYFTNNPIPTDSTDELIYDLEAGGTYTMSGDVSLPLTNVTLRGDKEDHPTITMSSGSFVSEGEAVKFRWLDFDCSSFTGSGVLKLDPTINSGLTTINSFGIIPYSLIFQSCKVTGLAYPLIYDGGGKYAIQTLLIKDCIIQQNTLGTNSTSTMNNLISLYASFVKDLTITNSTIYNLQKATGGYMIQYANGASVSKVYGSSPCTTWASGSVTITNSTFWQVVYGKQMANYSGMSKSYNTLTVQYCIFVDCGSDQVIKRLTNSSTTMTRVYGYNSYWYDGAFGDDEVSTSASSYDNSSTYIEDDPAFKDAADGDFTPTGAGQVEYETGDPRWFE